MFGISRKQPTEDLNDPTELGIYTLNNDTIAISLPGDPITKMRPRFARKKWKVRTFDQQSEEKETVRWKLKARMMNRYPTEGPLALSLVCVFHRPASRTKLKEIFHSVKPDLDNLIKWIGDVGNGILWYDDKQIVSIAATKIYGEHPRTIITVSKVDDH